MKKIIYFIYIISLFISCDFSGAMEEVAMLNEINIVNINKSYTANVNNSFQITPTVNANNKNNLQYLWYSYSNIATEIDTLSTDKSLDILINPQIFYPGNSYTLVFKVTDKETGVYTVIRTRLDIQTTFTAGTMLLTKTEGKMDIAMLSMQNQQLKLHQNIFSTSNKGQSLSLETNKLFFVNPNKYASFLKVVLAFAKDNTGGVVLDPQTFIVTKNMRQAFDLNLKSEILNPELYFMGRVDYILMNSSIYKRATNMQSVNWEPPLVVIDPPTNYLVSPTTLSIGGNPTFYDYQNGRLLQHSPFNQGTLIQLPKTGMDISYFDFNNFGKNLQMVSSGNLSEPGGYWLLMKNTDNNNYYIYKFRVTPNEQYISTAKVELNKTITPNIKNAITFSSNKDYSDLLFYSTKDKVYSVLISNIENNKQELTETEQINMNLFGKQITSMKFVSIAQSTIDDAGNEEIKYSPQVRLGIKDNSNSKKTGGVMFFEVKTLGGMHCQKLFEHIGFCDEVLDIEEKYS